MSKERVYFRVVKGGLQPADNYATSLLQSRKFKVGDIVAAQLVKPRNSKFNRLVHQIGNLVRQNVDGFELMDAHQVIKRLQIEGRIACDEVGIMIDGYGMAVQFIPRSLSFATMGEEEYIEAARAMCVFLARKYWTTCSADQIERMAQAMVD